MWGSHRKRIRQALDLQWEPRALVPCALPSAVRLEREPLSSKVGHGPSAIEKGLAVTVLAVVSTLLSSTYIHLPGNKGSKTVAEYLDNGDPQVRLAVADEQPAEVKYPLWLAVSTDVAAIADATGQVRWNSVGNGLIDLQRTANGVRLDFADRSYMVIRTPWWAKATVSQAF